MDLDDIRSLGRQIYSRRKRNKSLPPIWGGFRFLIFDGHESNGSYRRHCRQCLQRTVHTKKGDRVEYYHKYVLALLRHGKGHLLLDAEDVLPGEGEMAAAIRLFQRVMIGYPRAFDVVTGDALYLHPGFCNLVVTHRKHFIMVLKNENRDLLVDARSLCEVTQPTSFAEKKIHYTCWDIEGFTSWPQFGPSVRVVRSLETSTDQAEQQASEWFWATSLPQTTASAQTIVHGGHGRWDIENYGFNELCNQWHADHVYKHDPNALAVFRLLLFVAYNLFHAFMSLNLKPEIRAGRTQQYWVRLVASEFYSDFYCPSKRAPP